MNCNKYIKVWIFLKNELTNWKKFDFFFFFWLQEKLYGKSLILADREMVEEKADEILMEASSSNVAFLVVGDPFGYAIDIPF